MAIRIVEDARGRRLTVAVGSARLTFRDGAIDMRGTPTASELAVRQVREVRIVNEGRFRHAVELVTHDESIRFGTWGLTPPSTRVRTQLAEALSALGFPPLAVAVQASDSPRSGDRVDRSSDLAKALLGSAHHGPPLAVAPLAVHFWSSMAVVAGAAGTAALGAALAFAVVFTPEADRVTRLSALAFVAALAGLGGWSVRSLWNRSVRRRALHEGRVTEGLYLFRDWLVLMQGAEGTWRFARDSLQELAVERRYTDWRVSKREWVMVVTGRVGRSLESRTIALDDYDFPEGLRTIPEFVNALERWRNSGSWR